jgi:hypothetical protein
MSRSMLVVPSLVLLALSLPAAAQTDSLPPNIELKPGAEAIDQAASTNSTAQNTDPSDPKTRQIITEPRTAAPAGAAAGTPPPPPPGAAPPPAEPKAESVGAPDAAPPGGKPPAVSAEAPPPGPGAPPPGPAAAPGNPQEIVVALQSELKRVGCDPGEIDGVWGGHSREALAAFGHFAKVDVANLAPTPEILVIIQGKAPPVCQVGGQVEAAPPHAPPRSPPPARGHGYGGGGYGGGGYGGGGGGY